MSIFNKYALIIFCTLLAADVAGQAARSPYTSLGIGEPYGNALVNTQGMGGVGVSQPQFWYLNNQNPALLIHNNLTVFQAGMFVESRTARMDTISEKNLGGNVNYLVTAFPIKHNKSGQSTWSSSLGLMPFTAVNYRFQYVDSIDNSNELVNVDEQGTGGLNQLYWSNGVRLSQDLSVGLKMAYIFSSIKTTYSNQLQHSNQPFNFPVTIETKAYVKDLLLSAGISYSKDSLLSHQKYRLSVGAVYSFASDLNTHFRSQIYKSSPTSGAVLADTIGSTQGHYHIPRSLTAGISLSRGSKWTLGTEVSYQNWKSFTSEYKQQEGLGPAWRAAFGGEFTPDLVSTSFFKRMTYRTGVSMQQYPFLANGNQVKDVGINIGLSLPAGRSSVDFAFTFGKRGNKSENILEESYFKAYLGITFNDQWFIKRKFD